ncbi:MAG: nucleoside hydrolase [Bacilli bacterium]|nr:nucleoside hydrolase [Bacilli bacterium]
MRIGIDIDNVISNFNEELLKEYLNYDKQLRNTGIVNKNAEYIRRGMFDWTEDEEISFYRNHIERIAKSLKVKDGAKEYIDKLIADGHIVYIITGRDNGEYSDPYNMTKKWLDENFIKYHNLILTNAYKNDKHGKTEKCLENNIDVMIDDSVNICRDCIENNVTTLLMDTPYNGQADMPRVHNWEEIYEFISNYKREKINVILDTDTYNECDDQFALAYMLKSQDIFNIEAITVAPYSRKTPIVSVKEGQENSYNEILKICKWLDFDTTNKVFKGAEDYICNGYDENNDAVNKIIEIALRNDKTYVMAIGAITNVALAIKKAPEIVEKIEVIWLGGHSLLQDNNLEFNFRQDIDAVRIVFDSKVKLTIVPCKNVASNLRTTIYELNYYLKDKSELCNYLIDRFYNDGYHGIQERRVIWDISVIAYMINKNWFTSIEISCPNINNDTSYELTNDRHIITMINYIDVNKVYTDLFKKLGE